MSRVTAKTITDAQILELRASTFGKRLNAHTRTLRNDCTAALAGHASSREMCALIWNKRVDEVERVTREQNDRLTLDRVIELRAFAKARIEYCRCDELVHEASIHAPGAPEAAFRRSAKAKLDRAIAEREILERVLAILDGPKTIAGDPDDESDGSDK